VPRVQDMVKLVAQIDDLEAILDCQSVCGLVMTGAVVWYNLRCGRGWDEGGGGAVVTQQLLR
jgi:hypothetical protein